jgi:methylglyoxal synthase
MNSSQRTLIGVLASHDDPQPNASLVSTFSHLYHHHARGRLDRFHFVITGGTWDRILYGDEKLELPPLSADVAEWLRERATPLPGADKGGVIVLTYLISQRQCSVVWPFYAPYAHHWQRHENLAFIRLCDQWHVKRLMNRGSVLVWFDNEAEVDRNRNLQPVPPQLTLARLGGVTESRPFPPRPSREPFLGGRKIGTLLPRHKAFSEMTIALIAHDEMKARMTEFAIDHEAELDKFGTILATGTTGREVAAATSESIHDKMIRYHSGPKGGDIEIATAILYDLCHVVIFFVDPLHAHPHIEDIRVVFQACMITDHVVMITNEMHAREFMSRVVRDHEGVNLYAYEE